jgi:hypothetical protein
MFRSVYNNPAYPWTNKDALTGGHAEAVECRPSATARLAKGSYGHLGGAHS